MADDLTIRECLQIARTFLWLANEGIVRSARGPEREAQAPPLNAMLVMCIKTVDRLRDEDYAPLDSVPCNTGLPPNAAVQRLAELILACKGTGCVSFNSMAFTCDAAK